MARDDFPKVIKEALAKRVGYHCSRPECGCSTTGPHSDDSKSVNVGVAAHITAASEGGPRYAPSLTSNERKEATNGIWLCQTCANLIDKDAAQFPVGPLNSWKKEAEQRANDALGTPASSSGIQFHLKNWKAWRDAGAQGDFIDPIADARKNHVILAGVVALQNIGDRELLLARLRFEFRRDDSVVLDLPNEAVGDSTLLTGKWQDVVLGLELAREAEAHAKEAQSIWLVCDLPPSEEKQGWLLSQVPDLADLERFHTV